MRSDEFALAWLKVRIEDMSEQQPMWSRSAYTHRRTPHVVFCNGAIKLEGDPAAELGGSVRDLAEATLNAVRKYRETIPGDALLIWRCEPEVRRDGDRAMVYTRLAFESDIWS